MIDALLLDAHGTLLELEPPVPALRGMLEQRFGVRLTADQAERAIAAEISYYRAHLGEGRDAGSIAALRGRCAAELRRALAAERVLDSVGADELTEALLASLVFRPYPDVMPALQRLRARHPLRIVVASNWDASLPDTLQAVGLRPLLDGVVTSAEVGAPKPAAALFRRALELAGEVPPERAMHVGDSLEEDVAGAGAAGIRAVLVARHGRRVPPGVRAVRSLEQLLELPELAVAKA